MTASYDERRGTYSYDIDSELEVTGNEPFELHEATIDSLRRIVRHFEQR